MIDYPRHVAIKKHGFVARKSRFKSTGNDCVWGKFSFCISFENRRIGLLEKKCKDVNKVPIVRRSRLD